MSFAKRYLKETHDILKALDPKVIDDMAKAIAEVRNDSGRLSGRLFILGVGGSAATASHAVNDFRKIAGVETYAPTDNVAELTARTNDDGWDSTFSEWLMGSRIGPDDAILVLSVGGGSSSASPNIVEAVHHASEVGALILGIVGRDGGYTARYADYCVVIPPLVGKRITPHTEGIASVVLHLLVSHPALS
jgi:D-sedoheptulose 7-phosphate isomerase